VSKVFPKTEEVSLFKIVNKGQAIGLQVSTLDQADTPDAVPTHEEVNEVPALDVKPSTQRTECDSKVSPLTAVVSLFKIVRAGQATATHVSTLVQEDIPKVDRSHVTVKETPALEMNPLLQSTTCVAKVNPVIEDVSLFATVNAGQFTTSQVKTLAQADIPGLLPTHDDMKVLPEADV